VWWSEKPRRDESFSGGEQGVHVERRRLEEVLTRASEAAGVRVYEGFSARGTIEVSAGWSLACRGADGGDLELRTSWLLDATGRRGFLARREGRVPDPTTATLALLGRFRRRGGWGPDAEGRTLVESWADGWAWSVPLDEEVRCFAAMVDKQPRRDTLTAALARAPHLGPMAAAAEPAGRTWACSASLYSATRYARRGMLLTGDAGSFIDPLSSFGVKKALSSGWLAGVAAHTALVDAPLTDVALDFFDRHERAVYASYRRASVAFYEQAAEAYRHDYWRRRAEAASQVTQAQPAAEADALEAGAVSVPEVAVRRAHEAIRGRARLDAFPGRTLRTFRGAAIEGHRIVLQDQVASDTYPRGMRFARGVDLRRLVEEAPRHADVPEAWTAYNRACAPVSLPDFLTALSIAFAAGFLEHRDG
jgi:flavin-dependent dehydrogenase